MPLQYLAFGVPPFRLSGVVVVALLNDPAQVAALGDAARQPPYKAPPTAPVLGVKPRNTWALNGAAIAVPPEGVVLAASLGVVIGRTACGVHADQALAHVAGYTLAVDLQLPLASHYRPAIRQRARDGFCPIGPAVVPAAQVADPDALVLHIGVDGVLKQAAATAGRTRGVARLIADVSDFMTLNPGDLLLLGCAAGAPIAHAGQAVAVQAAGLGTLDFTLVAEAAAANAMDAAAGQAAPTAGAAA